MRSICRQKIVTETMIINEKKKTTEAALLTEMEITDSYIKKIA